MATVPLLTSTIQKYPTVHTYILCRPFALHGQEWAVELWFGAHTHTARKGFSYQS